MEAIERKEAKLSSLITFKILNPCRLFKKMHLKFTLENNLISHFFIIILLQKVVEKSS